jgi:hypothetical protein
MGPFQLKKALHECSQIWSVAIGSCSSNSREEFDGSEASDGRGNCRRKGLQDQSDPVDSSNAKQLFSKHRMFITNKGCNTSYRARREMTETSAAEQQHPKQIFAPLLSLQDLEI